MRYQWVLELPAVCLLFVVLSTSLNARAEDSAVSRHSLWLQGSYVPRPCYFPLGDSDSSPQFSEDVHVGIAGGYAYRIANNSQFGVAASMRGLPGDDEYGSIRAFSLPLLFSFDPPITRSVRLVMTAGIGYLHLWGSRTYGGDAWRADGIEAMVDLGAAVRVSSQVELLASVGARGGKARLFSLAVPIGLGLRFSFGQS